MKKIFIFIMMLILSGCSHSTTSKSPNELLLDIKNYSCKMQITCSSNKTKNEYTANQEYYSSGKYSMEFLNKSNLKINYINSTLNISSSLLNTNIVMSNYEEINKNPLFLSYFINSYFNLENTSSITSTENSIEMILPNNSNNIYSAELVFRENKPHSLTYFDKNGNAEVNIIYSEFNSIA